MRMVQVYKNLSLNVSASQTLWFKISLFEFPLLKLYRSICDNCKFCEQFNTQVSSLLMFYSTSVSFVKNTSGLLSYRLKPFFLHLICNEALYSVK